jgi:hypothetical protein
MKSLLNSWEIYALLALVCFLSSITLRKYIFNKSCNYCDYIFVFSLSLFIFSFFSLFAIKNIYKKELFKKNSFFDVNTFLIFISTFLLLAGLFFKIKGYQLVPNIALIDGFMEPLKVISLFFISYLFFNTGFNLKVLSGIILSAIGVIVIIKNK